MISPLRTFLFSTLLLCICGCTPSPNRPQQESREVSIAELKSFCKGYEHLIAEDVYVRCVVGATDWMGELYKSAIVVDETGALEIAIDLENIDEHLAIYSDVRLNCKGLMLARIGGKIKVGLPPTGDFPIDNIGEESLDRYIQVIGTKSDIEIKTKRFSEVGVEDIGNLVRFEGVRFCEEEQGLNWCDVDEEGEPVTTTRTLVDSQGGRFAVTSINSCHYAKEKLPKNEIAVIGAIDYADDHYFLRIVNKSFTEL